MAEVDKKRSRRRRHKDRMSMKDTKEMLRDILQGYGLRPMEFGNLIDKAVRNGWSPEHFESQIYQSPAFKRAFPGIFRSDGSLRMSPSEYRQISDQYKELAQRYGLYGELGPGRIGKLIKGNVSPQELTDRFTAISRMKEYGTAFDVFKKIVGEQMPQNGKLTDENLYEFIMGKAPKAFYDLWEQTMVGTSAASAGVDLSAAEMRSLAQRLPGMQTEEQLQANFQKLAKDIKTIMPLSQLTKLGVNKSDLLELEFGGPNQADIGERVDQIYRNYEGAHQDEGKAFDNTLETGAARGSLGGEG
jgi:hypothetical protein